MNKMNLNTQRIKKSLNFYCKTQKESVKLLQKLKLKDMTIKKGKKKKIYPEVAKKEVSKLLCLKTQVLSQMLLQNK